MASEIVENNFGLRFAQCPPKKSIDINLIFCENGSCRRMLRLLHYFDTGTCVLFKNLKLTYRFSSRNEKKLQST